MAPKHVYANTYTDVTPIDISGQIVPMQTMQVSNL